MRFLTALHSWLAFAAPQPSPWLAKWVDRLIGWLERRQVDANA